MKYLLCVLALFVCASASASPCNSTQYDMLTWFRMSTTWAQIYHLTGNANPLYSYLERTDSVSGRFFWIKGAAGYPFDLNYYDANYIYQWATEYNWNDPGSYKAFSANTTMPWSPRCVTKPPAGTYGTKLATIELPTSPYTIYGSDCTPTSNNNLGHVINEIWGPTPMSLGGNLPSNALVLTLSYRYSCDSTYGNCKYKETFDLMRWYGLVRWTYYVLQNGQYVQQNQTMLNNEVSGGSPAPVHPCWQ